MFIVLGVHLVFLIFGLMVFIMFIRNISFPFFGCFSCYLSPLLLGLQFQVPETEAAVLQLTDALVIVSNPFLSVYISI